MEHKAGQPLTRDSVIGMQVIGPDGYTLGKVKDISLCVGEMDQAVVIETPNGEEEVRRWSEVAGAGDVILLKAIPPHPGSHSTVPENILTQPTFPPAVEPVHCGGCGTALTPGSKFCGSCGKQVG